MAVRNPGSQGRRARIGQLLVKVRAVCKLWYHILADMYCTEGSADAQRQANTEGSSRFRDLEFELLRVTNDDPFSDDYSESGHHEWHHEWDHFIDFDSGFDDGLRRGSF